MILPPNADRFNALDSNALSWMHLSLVIALEMGSRWIRPNCDDARISRSPSVNPEVGIDGV